MLSHDMYAYYDVLDKINRGCPFKLTSGLRSLYVGIEPSGKFKIIMSVVSEK